MNQLMCPFCHNNVPYGATVCRGCGAEIDYTNPFSNMLGIICGAVGAIIGWNATDGLEALVIAGVFFVIGYILGGSLLADKLGLKDSPTFHRTNYHR